MLKIWKLEQTLTQEISQLYIKFQKHESRTILKLNDSCKMIYVVIVTARYSGSFESQMQNFENGLRTDVTRIEFEMTKSCRFI